MLRVLSLLLPCLVPSWRFFQAIEPSPRVEWRVVDGNWQELQPRPPHLSLPMMLRRLFWNPARNEALFWVSLSERLEIEPSPHTHATLHTRIGARLAKVRPAGLVQFRISWRDCVNGKITSDVSYVSAPFDPSHPAPPHDI